MSLYATFSASKDKLGIIFVGAFLGFSVAYVLNPIGFRAWVDSIIGNKFAPESPFAYLFPPTKTRQARITIA
jgi:hypothetical protein